MKAMGHDMAHTLTRSPGSRHLQQLATFIRSEHPQTIALVVAHLNPSKASALLYLWAARAARPSRPPCRQFLYQVLPEVINKIALVIRGKLNALGEFSRESYGGVRTVSKCSTASTAKLVKTSWPKG